VVAIRSVESFPPPASMAGCPIFPAVNRHQNLAPLISVIPFQDKSSIFCSALGLLSCGCMSSNPARVARLSRALSARIRVTTLPDRGWRGLPPAYPWLPSWRQAAALPLEAINRVVAGIQGRWARERRRRKVGRAYDMALEVARVIPRSSEVLDVGCGNGFIAHHLSAMLGTSVVGIDLGSSADAPIDYRRYTSAQFPVRDDSFDAVLLCYVLHHAQDVSVVLNEMRRVLREGGMAVIYEDIPQSWVDKGVCWIHNQQWRGRTGPCTFRRESEWRALFESFGFEIVSERRLSRWRNLTHPVNRTLFTLRLR
jgi:SAM-dependent methyltransferase